MSTAQRRAFTLAELLVGMSVLTLFLVFAFTTLLPVVEYMGAAQAKGDTQGDVIPFLYKFERDLHNSDAIGIFYDNSGATALPTPSGSPGATVVSVTTFAVPTAVSGTSGAACDQYAAPNFFQITADGAPAWQGYNVYLLRNTTLSCVFESETISCVPANPCSSAAGSAITSAKAVSNPPPYAWGIGSISLAADKGLNSQQVQFVDVKITSLSTVDGRTQETTYVQNVQTRN